MSEVIKQNIHEEIVEHFEPRTSSRHLYRVTHFLDGLGRQTGQGKIEQQEIIHYEDGSQEIKWRRTGGDYSKFVENLRAEQLQAQQLLEHQQAMSALAEKREREHEDDWKDYVKQFPQEPEAEPPHEPGPIEAVPKWGNKAVEPVPVFPAPEGDE